MAPEVGAALVSGGAGLLGSVFNAHSMAKYNKTQKEIAKMNNEYNYRMFNEQNQWNLEQWQRENEYNTPLAQRQRFEQAGINPYMAMGNMTSGNAQGNITSAVPQPAEFPNLRPNMAVGEGVTQSINQAITAYSASAMVEKTLADAALARTDQQTRLAENIAKLKKMGADTEAQLLENSYAQSALPNRLKLLDKSVEDLTNHASLMYQQAREKEIANNINEVFGMSLAREQVNKLQAETKKYLSEAAANTELLPYQKAELVSRKVLNFANAHKMNVEAWQVQQLTPSLVEYYKASSFENRQYGLMSEWDRNMKKVYPEAFYTSPLDVEDKRGDIQFRLKNTIFPSDLLNGIIGLGILKGVGKAAKGLKDFKVDYKRNGIGFQAH